LLLSRGDLPGEREAEGIEAAFPDEMLTVV